MANGSIQNLSVGNFSVHPNVEATFPQGPFPSKGSTELKNLKEN